MIESGIQNKAWETAHKSTTTHECSLPALSFEAARWMPFLAYRPFQSCQGGASASLLALYPRYLQRPQPSLRFLFKTEDRRQKTEDREAGRERAFGSMESVPCRYYCLIVAIVALVRSASSQSFIYKGCSQESYSDSTYESNVQVLLGTLVSQAHDTNYYNASAGGGGSVVYGLYQCRSDLGGNECQNCVQNAESQLTQACVRTRGARIQLDGCSLHYDRVNFFGQPDNTFIYKTCSGTMSGDADFYKHLNAVLSGLQTGNFIEGKGFRLANSGDSHTGYVHGLAQCQGDLSLQDCSACINSAVQRLRDACASAVSGSAYLGKCYARYAQDAFYRNHSDDDPDDDDDDDEAGKTVAIILGLLAGVALIVVFLSFLKQLLRKGKA